MAIGYNMTSVNPSQWADMINAIDSGTYPDEINVTNNQTQWDALIGAIEGIGGNKTLHYKPITQDEYSQLDNREHIHVIIECNISGGTRGRFNFDVVKPTTATSIYTEGYYYDASYNGIISINASPTSITINNTWSHINGSALNNPVISLYQLVYE